LENSRSCFYPILKNHIRQLTNFMNLQEDYRFLYKAVEHLINSGCKPTTQQQSCNQRNFRKSTNHQRDGPENDDEPMMPSKKRTLPAHPAAAAAKNVENSLNSSSSNQMLFGDQQNLLLLENREECFRLLDNAKDTVL